MATIFEDQYREYPIDGTGLLLYIEATDRLERGVLDATTASPLISSALRSVEVLAYIDAIMAASSPGYAKRGYSEQENGDFKVRRAFLANLDEAIRFAWQPAAGDEYLPKAWRRTPALEPVRQVRATMSRAIGIRYLHFGTATTLVAALGEQVAKPGVLAELLNFLIRPRSHWRKLNAESQAAVADVERMRLENEHLRWESLGLAVETTLKVASLPVRLRDLDAAVQQAGFPRVPVLVRDQLEAMHKEVSNLVQENTGMPRPLAQALTDNAADLQALTAMGQVGVRAGEVVLGDPSTWAPPK
ncbi:hypothetical protein [Pengzhenrongella sp.]|jgi:hypothetical protein|uniref:hypothetical protein n=1 Tax=Pengzhenrongella sp. TaxID=2888820 RepID=UPI002F93E547